MADSLISHHVVIVGAGFDGLATAVGLAGPAVRITRILLAALAAAGLCGAIARAGDAAAGRSVFLQQCSICHSASPDDHGGAQGPSLAGLLGRHAAADPAFSYTAALRAAPLTWDAATLDRFLASPTSVVPGSAMVAAVPNSAERGDLIAYFASLSSSSRSSVAAPPAPAPAGTAPIGASEDWRKDFPGRVHHIDIASLPPPYATASANNGPRLVARPAAAQLSVPAGFRVATLAAHFDGPRKMLVAANGDIFISEIYGGRITALRPAPNNDALVSRTNYATGLTQPFGLAFYPDAEHAQWLYVAQVDRVVRYAYTTGDLSARGEPQTVVADLPHGGGHSTRDITFSPDGRRLFVSVGSGSNIAETMSKKTSEQIRVWEAQHGLGAAWDRETDRAAVLVFEVGSQQPGRRFATGLRNCVSLTRQPQTGELWCTTNERDLLGDDLVPDYSTRIREGAFYGWPWYYLGAHEDPRLAGERPDLRGHVTVPDVLFQSHSAPLGLTFYTATNGASAFPAGYVGDGFVSFHGSWNRGFRTGHKIVRMRMHEGVPTGEYEDFLTGFIVDNGDAWGRPVATVELADGSLLMSDDGAGVIYRISY
ncbi:MAG TPA: PQQ-dependent sugar dehydrogenase [Steroidobacteraceae bacterium]|nr:PQQ-dependent sugar dehydrogenase [Steroidobacteraceae bacterium]